MKGISGFKKSLALIACSTLMQCYPSKVSADAINYLGTGPYNGGDANPEDGGAGGSQVDGNAGEITDYSDMAVAITSFTTYVDSNFGDEKNSTTIGGAVGAVDLGVASVWNSSILNPALIYYYGTYGNDQSLRLPMITFAYADSQTGDGAGFNGTYDPGQSPFNTSTTLGEAITILNTVSLTESGATLETAFTLGTTTINPNSNYSFGTYVMTEGAFGQTTRCNVLSFTPDPNLNLIPVETDVTRANDPNTNTFDAFAADTTVTTDIGTINPVYYSFTSGGHVESLLEGYEQTNTTIISAVDGKGSSSFLPNGAFQ
jgi:hypothetical protein